MQMRAPPPVLSPCPNCRMDQAVFSELVTDRKLWRVVCTACEARCFPANSKARAAAYWNRGEFVRPLDLARQEREERKNYKPYIVRNSFPGLGQPPSQYPLISGLTIEGRILFRPGKYGREDRFYLESGSV